MSESQWITKKFCRYCEEEDDLCDCLQHHMDFMAEVGCSYSQAEERFEWEGHESDLGEWASDMCYEVYPHLCDIPTFITIVINWAEVASVMVNDYYQIADRENKNYIYLYREE
jgi:hypothetical protein